jgi:hypothetical protein
MSTVSLYIINIIVLTPNLRPTRVQLIWFIIILVMSREVHHHSSTHHHLLDHFPHGINHRDTVLLTVDSNKLLTTGWDQIMSGSSSTPRLPDARHRLQLQRKVMLYCCPLVGASVSGNKWDTDPILWVFGLSYQRLSTGHSVVHGMYSEWWTDEQCPRRPSTERRTAVLI